jgi:transposase
MWYKKGKSKGGGTMKERVLGCDVSKDYIILHDGSQAYKFSLENFKSLQKLVNNSIVDIEQTGAYGLRWGQVLEDLGAKVYRALIRQHMRNEKDITKHANRLSQYLAVIFPTKNYCDLDRNGSKS